MKKRFIAVFLLFAMVSGLLAFPVQAAEAEADLPALQFLTEARFKGGSGGGWTTLSAADDDFVMWSPDNRHIALLDPFGNVLIPASEHTIFYHINDQFFAAGKSYESYALFIGTKRLTSYIYSSVEIEGEYVRCDKKNGGVDYYTLNGQKMPLPKVPSGWTLVTIVGGEAAIIKAVNYNITVDGRPTWKYAMCNYSGKIIRDSSSNHRIEKISGTEKLVRVSGNMSTYVDTKGNTLLGTYLDNLRVGPDGNSFVAMDYWDVYHVIDSNLKLLWSIEAEKVQYLSADKLLILDKEGNGIVKTISGEELLRTPCDRFKTIEGEHYNVGQPADWGFVLFNGNTATLYNMEVEHLLTVNDVKSANAGDTYFSVNYKDGHREYYNKEGKLLFSYGSDREILCDSGILMEEKNDAYAVLNSKGEQITDFIYRVYSDIAAYGLITVIRKDTEEKYIINSAGQTLNEKPLLGQLHFYGPLSVYQYEEGYGIVRYIGPNDSQFLDVKNSDWYFEGVEYCAENELFSGTAKGRFSPDDSMTRAMLVTVLWRLEGQPQPTKAEEFTDVENGTWYSNAVAWAAENGIVNGVGNGLFNPNGNVTREQIATIMLRYAGIKGYDTTQRADISVYPDAGKVSAYATDAIRWANAAGIISGSSENGKVLILPQGNATRAQVATILMRYVKNIAEE